MLQKYSFYLTLFILAGCFGRGNESDWKTINTAAELWETYPERLRSLFTAIDTERSALRPLKDELAAGDTVAAAVWLVDYFQRQDRSWIVGTLDPLEESEARSIARIMLNDSVDINGVRDRIPVHPDGGWQWDFTGPEADAEFAYSLNTQSYLPVLYFKYQQDGASEYVALFDKIVKDWIVHHPLPAEGDSIYLVLQRPSQIDYRDIGEVEWRTLDTGRRLGSAWPQLFYAFQDADAFSPATRLLMLAGMAEQAAYLRKYHKSGHNWTTMEMNGLALVGLGFPEFKAATEWADYALQVMSEEINRQVYPDGTQTEISTKTQWVALRRFESVAVNFGKAGREVSDAYVRRLEAMYQYLAYAMRPDGHQPLNNDSDREDLRPRVMQAAAKFERPDWVFIATNGEQGERPEVGPTITYPWAGIHVLRNGWDKDAHWAFFDTGPYGTGHQHRDMLHLSVSAFGKDLLVDGGRYTHRDYFSFDPTIWRGYFRSSLSHNTLLVDGNGQKMGPLRAEVPLEAGRDFLHAAGYDYAQGTFDRGYENTEGQAAHTRSVLYLHDRYWIVLDQFATDRPREVQVLWHYAPDIGIAIRDGQIVSNGTDGPGLRIVPLGAISWEPEIVMGQEKPYLQGWYSANYGEKVPNPTVVYRANLDQSATFAWVLIPENGPMNDPDITFAERADEVAISIAGTGKQSVNIILPKDKNPAKLNVSW